ncbi:hypothetical protein IKF86_00350 [Candidatus Saccharibacteria bacterium]|nr:hypothetical protein [Candidatus Saccharibacteria bacterium]
MMNIVIMMAWMMLGAMALGHFQMKDGKKFSNRVTNCFVAVASTVVFLYATFLYLADVMDYFMSMTNAFWALMLAFVTMVVFGYLVTKVLRSTVRFGRTLTPDK